MERNTKSVQREIPTFLSAMFDSGDVMQQKISLCSSVGDHEFFPMIFKLIVNSKPRDTSGSKEKILV